MTLTVLAAGWAALAVWLMISPGRARFPGAAPVTERPDAGVLGVRVRLPVACGPALVALLIVPAPVWVRLPLAAGIGVAVFVGLGMIGPDHRVEEAIRRAYAPEACMLLAAAVEAGVPLGAALWAVAPRFSGVVGSDLRRVMAGIDIGLAEREAWAVLADSPVWRRACLDIGRVAGSGAAVAPVLRRHSEDLVDAARQARLQRARRVGVRSVFPLTLCFLPAFVLVGVVPTVGGMVMRFFG